MPNEFPVAKCDGGGGRPLSNSPNSFGSQLSPFGDPSLARRSSMVWANPHFSQQKNHRRLVGLVLLAVTKPFGEKVDG